jgi:DNA-binding NtrC family response regulator
MSVGTAFLDEIGDMPLGAQAKFLRTIESKEVQRLGDRRTSRLDVRIIAATNQDLEDLVRQRKFRQDLFFRLDVLRIALPPLRERTSDIPLLVRHFFKQLGAQFGGGARLLDDRALEVICRYSWPGNVRELRNVLEAAMARASTPVLGLQDLPREFLQRVDQVETIAQSERDLLLSALLAVNWDKSKAAKRLLWSRATIYRKLAHYHIVSPGSARSRR